MCQSNHECVDAAEYETGTESVEHWIARCSAAEATVTRLAARLRGRDQRILLLERALARTVALHQTLEDSLEQRLEQCMGSFDSARPSEPSRGTTSGELNGGVTVHLPHLTRTLSLLFDVMREQWTKWDPERPPKSSTVARAIDAKLGLKGQSTGEASRSAQTFAAALRPDSLNDADGRHR